MGEYLASLALALVCKIDGYHPFSLNQSHLPQGINTFFCVFFLFRIHGHETRNHVTLQKEIDMSRKIKTSAIVFISSFVSSTTSSLYSSKNLRLKSNKIPC
jgi:hypothetical protein